MSIRTLILLGTLSALTGEPAAGRAADPATVSFIERFGGSDFAPPVMAVGLRATAEREPAGPVDVVLLVDTSASQVGVHLTRSAEAVEGLLEKARPGDRFRIAAVDVACTPLDAGFGPADGAEARAALQALAERTPLGSTDIVTVLAAAADLFNTPAAGRAIVYVGDGPGLNGIDAGDFFAVQEKLRVKRIAVSSIGIGDQVNWPCLAAVANATGGMLLVPADGVSPRDAGARLGPLAVSPVLWPEDVVLSAKTPPANYRGLPGRLPPLRTDRDSIILIGGQLEDGRLDMTLESPAEGHAKRQAEVEIPAAEPRPENAYLGELFRNAFPNDGAFLPLLGRDGLELARTTLHGEAATLAALARQAEATGAAAAALRLAVAALRRDPDNVEAGLVYAVASKGLGQTEQPVAVSRQPAAVDDEPADAPARAAGREPLPPPAAVADPQPVPAARDITHDPEELADFNRLRKVRAQQIEQETAVGLRNARQRMAADPDRARADLKELLRIVQTSEDLDVAIRDRLARQIEISVRESIARSREKAECDLAAERNRAIGRERMRLDEDLRRREGRIKQLTERYNALVEEGIRIGYNRAEHYPAVLGDNTRLFYDTVTRDEPPTTKFTEAERLPGEQLMEEAPELFANHPVPMTARILARKAFVEAQIRDYDAENVRVKRDMERGFMDCLHQVDTAAIPLADEPPIIYPSASRWRELTKKREKYKSVDLANPGSNEQRIYEALQKPIQNIDFSETPLRDVIASIQDSQGIPVQIDTKAFEDAGLDLETPVTRSVSGISLRSALRLLLGDLDLTYLVKDEVLMITTKDKAAETLVVKVYPVADLVIPVNPQAGVNPFQTGGGLGGAGGINSGQGGGLGGGGGAMGGGIGGGGGMFQVSDARARIEKSPKPAKPPAERTAVKPGPIVDPIIPAADDAGDLTLPTDVLEAANLRGAISRYLAPRAARGKSGDAEDNAAAATQRDLRDLALRIGRVRATAADLGKEGRYDRAAELISATIAAGYAESWMYEALAVALEAAGRPKSEVERALLSAADFAASPTELLALANYLARFGSVGQAIRVCQQVTRLDPANREAFAIGMTLAARSNDVAALRWACAGVLSHEWPADQRDVAARAARLAKATIDDLRSQGKPEEAAAFEAAIDEALVRDLEVEVSWNGDADLDILVEEPPGTVCSLASPRSTSGGTLLGDTDAATDPTNATQRERYVAAQAFPGPYRILVRRAVGKVAAGTITAEMTLHKGTDREQKLKRQVPLGAAEVLLTVDLPLGRRREPLLDAQVAQDVAVQQNVGRAILAQQLAGIDDPAAAASLSQSRGGGGPQVAPGLPFGRGGATGYQPVISTLPEGTNMSALAVVSADRRYVRATVTPLFSGVGQVTQFNFSGGGARGAGGAGGGGGMGGGGMGGGGMGGGGMGGGGMGGGGMGGGGMGGGMPMCWVAREVYGPANPRWVEFRGWLLSDAPRWLVDLYVSHGEDFAAWIHDKPAVKAVLRSAMDLAIESQAH